MSSVSRIMSRCALSARTLWVWLLPLGHELGQCFVGAIRGRDVNFDQLIAACARLATRHAFASESQLCAVSGALRHLEVDRSVHRFDGHARAVQCFAERYR